MMLAALVNLCAFPLSGGLMPCIARDVFGLDQQGLGGLVALYVGLGLTMVAAIAFVWHDELLPSKARANALQ